MMKPARSPIPQGVATFLPVAAEEKRAVEAAVFAVFAERGYREIIPPMFEYLDVLTPGLDADLIEKSYKVVDRATGQVRHAARRERHDHLDRAIGIGLGVRRWC